MKLLTAGILMLAALATSPALAWTVSRSSSPVDDSSTVVLRQRADEEVRARYGQTYRPSLLIRCMENSTGLYINYGFFLTTGSMTVTTRVDKEDARKARWNVSTDYEAVGLWRGGQAIPFIKSLLGKDRLFVRVQPHGESYVDVTFSLDGLDDRIHSVAKTCRWDASTAAERAVSRSDIRIAQHRLGALGYDPGVADGMMGPRTKAAIRRFQADAGLSASGELDDRTLEAIKAQEVEYDELDQILDNVEALEGRN